MRFRTPSRRVLSSVISSDSDICRPIDRMFTITENSTKRNVSTGLHNACGPCLVDRPFSTSLLTTSTEDAHRQSSKKPLSSANQNIFNPKQRWLVNKDLDPFVRASVASLETQDRELDKRDTAFSVCLLGTGAGSPSIARSHPATFIRTDREGIYLFDAGEAVQMQFMKSRYTLSDVTKIFITHLHADHLFGLPGVLLGLAIISRKQSQTKKKRIQIYGPVGLFNYLAVSLTLSAASLGNLQVEVYELVSGGLFRYRRGATRNYKEFSHHGLHRRSIPQNEDGTWTVCVGTEITTPDQALALQSRPSGLHVTAAPLHHLPTLQCFGYHVSEPLTQPRSIDAKKAIALGIKPGKAFRLLKSGFDVTTEDGSNTIRADEVLVGERPAPRTCTILGDCYTVPPTMVRLCKDTDILVHEATLVDDEDYEKASRRGHSTPRMAGMTANRVNPKVLLLTHLPAISGNRSIDTAFVESAASQIRGRTRVQMGYDLLELLVPRAGLPW